MLWRLCPWGYTSWVEASSLTPRPLLLKKAPRTLILENHVRLAFHPPVSALFWPRGGGPGAPAVLTPLYGHGTPGPRAPSAPELCRWSHRLAGTFTPPEACKLKLLKCTIRGALQHWHPTPALLPGKSHGQRSLVGCSPWGREESDTTERLHFHFSLSCIGEGNGNPLQCSCLENPRDGGAWWAAVSGVAQSRTQLRQLSSSSSSANQMAVLSLLTPQNAI